MSSKPRIVYQEFGTVEPEETADIVDLPPQQQSIRLQATRSGRKGKTVTVITGFQHAPETLSKLLKTLKGQCGSGGTVKEQTVEIQGDHRQKLLAYLTKQGYKVKISGG